jgi:feruloyl esterase
VNRGRLLPVLSVALLAAGLVNPGSASAASCESLASLMLPQATITLAQSVPAGSFQPPATSGATRPAALTDLPAFCRVTATLMPTSDSVIKIEVWMPSAQT